MSDTLTPLIRDFLTWIAAAPRPYEDVMEAWRTSCPRLAVWEEAVDRGFVTRTRQGGALLVDLTDTGRAWLTERRRAA